MEVPGMNDRGFTMIEVLIALVILFIGLLGIMSMHITSIYQNVYTRHLNKATHLADKKMEELLSLPYSHPFLSDTDGDGSSGLDDADSTSADHFDPSNPIGGLFYVYWNVAPDVADTTIFTGVKTITVIVKWHERGTWHTYKISSLKVR